MTTTVADESGAVGLHDLVVSVTTAPAPAPAQPPAGGGPAVSALGTQAATPLSPPALLPSGYDAARDLFIDTLYLRDLHRLPTQTTLNF